MPILGFLPPETRDIQDVNGHSLRTKEDVHLGRREALAQMGKGALGVAGSVATTSALGGAINFLAAFDSEAGSTKWYRRGLKDPEPPGTTPKMCQDEILRIVSRYLIDAYKISSAYNLKAVLTRRGGKIGDYYVEVASWFCEPLHEVAMNTYMWKTGDSIGLDRVFYNIMEEKYYHRLASEKGISDFYREHVRDARNISGKRETEKWLVHSLFASAEPNPKHGIPKAEKYLAANPQQREAMIIKLSDAFANITWSESDKQDRDWETEENNKGPLNGWYRLLNAQWSAFFLVYHYDTITKNGGDVIYNHIEKAIRKRIGRIRGPAYYFDFDGKYKA